MALLVLPDAKYKNSFISAVLEYQAEDLPHYRSLNVAELEKNFDQYLSQLRSETQPEHTPPGKVPHTTYWLVEGDEFIGRVDIRHQLNAELEKLGGHIGYDVRPSQRRKGYGSLALKLGLEEAKHLGFPEVLITCDVNNLGSNKIIRAHGGQLQDTQPTGTGQPDKARYKIQLV